LSALGSCRAGEPSPLVCLAHRIMNMSNFCSSEMGQIFI